MNHEVETNKGKWMKAANKYKQELGLTWEDIRTLDKKSLKKVVREWDNQKWRNNLEEKPTLKWYKQGKQSIQYDQCYTNSIGSNFLAKARTNILQVEEYMHRRNRNHDKVCRLCDLEDEDLQHFLVTCPILEQKRDREIIESWRNIDKQKQTVDIMFKEKRYDRTGNILKKCGDIEKT